jgi:hypothetical protein
VLNDEGLKPRSGKQWYATQRLSHPERRHGTVAWQGWPLRLYRQQVYDGNRMSECPVDEDLFLRTCSMEGPPRDCEVTK